MKKIGLMFLLTLVSVIAFGQARLGYTFTDIKSEFGASKYNLEQGYREGIGYYIGVEMQNINVLYCFNSQKICTLTLIVPNTIGALNYLVEQYNSQYVIVSSTKWKQYSKNGIADIKLQYNDDGSCYFLWSIGE
jgi:hypothetical protein